MQQRHSRRSPWGEKDQIGAMNDVTPEKNLKPLSFWLEVFSGAMFRARSRPDFLSWLRSEEGEKRSRAQWLNCNSGDRHYGR